MKVLYLVSIVSLFTLAVTIQADVYTKGSGPFDYVGPKGESTDMQKSGTTPVTAHTHGRGATKSSVVTPRTLSEIPVGTGTTYYQPGY